MNKIILKMNDPEYCFNCPLARKRIHDDRYVCSIGHQGEYSFVWVYESIDMDSKTKPDWCPLKTVPSKREEKYASEVGDRDSGFIDGWNACVDEILADNKGWTAMVEDYIEQHKK